MTTALLIFSDLDGTLLEHANYSFDAARPALARAKTLGVPVILATSKTAVEVRDLAAAMQLDTPAIVENGGGLWFPDKASKDLHVDVETLDLSYHDILQRLQSIRGTWQNRFVGFNAMCVEDVMRETGLGRIAAQKAKMRDYSEPGIWTGNDKDFATFSRAVQEVGMHVLQGGRFLHVMAQTSKALQMQQLKRAYQRLWPGRGILTAALGDAPNDKDMIEAADYGFIIANPHGQQIPKLPNEAFGQIVRISETGPSGWNKAVNGLFDRLGLKAE